MIDKRLLTTQVLAAAWERHPKSGAGSAKPVSVPGATGTERETGAASQK
ncbi:MAG: hypothetical protein H0T42_32550 [Deltaproteobacteria bacterium]|nr:hypothetical protein [Deltaproteobacteria bacterium]